MDNGAEAADDEVELVWVGSEDVAVVFASPVVDILSGADLRVSKEVQRPMVSATKQMSSIAAANYDHQTQPTSGEGNAPCTS